ncbi:MAG: hypothetical protein IT435_12450 [Phycisphaerales bacterium]|nr:hypothetical protein [Phycisphaerales bacterium]
MRCTVLLQHDLPSGSRHFDWLIQVTEDPAAPVLAFRTAIRIDRPEALVFSAERIGDHRAFYLEHEGEVSGGRGMVVRVAHGLIAKQAVEPHRAMIEADFGSGPARLVGAEMHGGIWVFERTDME